MKLTYEAFSHSSLGAVNCGEGVLITPHCSSSAMTGLASEQLPGKLRYYSKTVVTEGSSVLIFIFFPPSPPDLIPYETLDYILFLPVIKHLKLCVTTEVFFKKQNY